MAEKKTVGDMLSEARREKGLSLDEIARETNISRAYLEAFEKNDFSVFPAEAYVVGFLKTYAEILDLDATTLISAYKHQIQLDQEVPLEELVGKRIPWYAQISPSLWRQIIMISLGLIVFFGLVLIFIQIASSSPANRPTSGRSLSHFSEATLPLLSHQKFKVGQDFFITNAKNKTIHVVFEKQNLDKSLLVQINGRKYNLKQQEVFALDTDGDSQNDFVLEILSAKPQAIRVNASLLQADQTLAFKSILGINSQFMEGHIAQENLLYTANEMGEIPIKIQGIDTGFCQLVVDNNEPETLQIERGFSKEVRFKQYIILSLGNAAAVKLFVNNREENGGGWGEVNKSIIYWKKERNRYNLVRTFLR
ncbi:MAG: helix-turn-helix domain-containing protein [Brevinematales bacterium]|nr:helix-turn-helix domain-containing protein [Brevinematales bacterium]